MGEGAHRGRLLRAGITRDEERVDQRTIRILEKEILPPGQTVSEIRA